ncbi:hypothetical protein [Nitrosomonas sp.]|uniref:hypothetical protein n=1 Tax=Nitrosomonas sp. TaxID=42353 RepID=UPI0037C6C34D
MNFKSKIERVGIVAGVMMGLLVVNPATASVVGSMNLDITEGCFSTEGVTCGNTVDTRQAYATGSFSFTDTLLSVYGGTTGLAQESFSYTGYVDMQAGATSDGLAPFADTSRSWGNFAALRNDPVMQLGLDLFESVSSNPSGQQSFAFDFTPVGGQAFTLFWELSNVNISTNSVTGEFAAWANEDVNWLSQLLFQQDLPHDAYFAGGVTLNAQTASAISEPMSLALFGIGILGLTVLQSRRKTLQSVA